MSGIVSVADVVRFLYYFLCFLFQNDTTHCPTNVATPVNLYLWLVITPFATLRLLLFLSYLSHLFRKQLCCLTVVYSTNLLAILVWTIWALA